MIFQHFFYRVIKSPFIHFIYFPDIASDHKPQVLSLLTIHSSPERAGCGMNVFILGRPPGSWCSFIAPIPGLLPYYPSSLQVTCTRSHESKVELVEILTFHLHLRSDLGSV